jgi:hypothetical protein
LIDMSTVCDLGSFGKKLRENPIGTRYEIRSKRRMQGTRVRLDNPRMRNWNCYGKKRFLYIVYNGEVCRGSMYAVLRCHHYEFVARKRLLE